MPPLLNGQDKGYKLPYLIFLWKKLMKNYPKDMKYNYYF